MVLSCFRPVASVIPGPFDRFVLRVLSLSAALAIILSRPLSPFSFLPSFLPPLQFFLLAPLRHVFAIDVVATSAAGVSPGSLNARFKREIKFILFIHSHGCQFSFLLCLSFLPPRARPHFSFSSPSFSLLLSLSLFLSVRAGGMKTRGGRRCWSEKNERAQKLKRR